MDDALSLLMFFFCFHLFCIGYTSGSSLADPETGGVVAFGGLIWHFAYDFLGEYYYPA
jgi:hypothetical protein